MSVSQNLLYIINTFQDFPARYAAADRAKKASILREMADAAVFNADGVSSSRKKPFTFFMQEEITSINKVDVSESSKTSTSAGDEGIEPPTCGFGDRCSAN